MSGFSLIETMRFEPGSGILRERLHAARFRNSARKLGYSGHEIAWAAALDEAETIDRTTRLRLELFSDGRFDIATVPFTPQDASTVWKVRIARLSRLDSTQPLLRHKTSLRGVYDAARAEYPRDEADEVLLLNDRGELCEGAITSLFVEADDGTLLTPPLSSGCLAGVLRTSLLCARKARVAWLLPSDLEGRAFFVGNSLRGLIRARMG